MSYRQRGLSSWHIQSVLPRYCKGYLWISLLISVFLLMVLTENGYIAGSQPRLPTSRSPLESSRTREEVLEKSFTSQQLFPDQEAQGAEPKPIPIKAKITKVPLAKHINSSMQISTEDFLIIVKTGATSLWRRLPIHLSTTLSNAALTPNIVIYSDSPDQILAHPVIDCLVNVSSRLKSHPDFELHQLAQLHDSQNLYLESASMEGDSYLPGGWRLSKYMFLPIFQHAARQWPEKRWYVFMEDDNYFFWEDLFAWIEETYGARHRSGEALYVGSPAFRMGEDFAHGGSGFAVNDVAMKRVFTDGEDLVSKYEAYMQVNCCGDQILSHAFSEKGITRDRSLDGTGTVPLQALSTFRIAVGTWNWCSPILNVHKVHQKDVSRLWNFEREFKVKFGAQFIRYKDIFTHFAMPTLVQSRSEWDNYASVKSFSSSADSDRDLTQEQRAKQPWYSKDQCHRACEEWAECLSWKYADDNCGLSHTAAMGMKVDEGILMTSGWMLDRIQALEGMTCKPHPES